MIVQGKGVKSKKTQHVVGSSYIKHYIFSFSLSYKNPLISKGIFIISLSDQPLHPQGLQRQADVRSPQAR
ncbi:MAG: hypothetical protein JWL92_337 [Candidatus Nomurabacteria bacterium]|nr:hypothetical protein [Candidatus Nomurabacteria bacterium]